MKYAGQIALALTVVTAVGAGRSVQNESGVGLSAVRFYRPASSQTVVDVFCRVPLLLVTPIGQSGGGAFRLAVSVRDSAGLELVSQTWLTPVRWPAFFRGRFKRTVQPDTSGSSSSRTISASSPM